MQHRDAIGRLRALFSRSESANDHDLLSGPGLLEQEPDLAQESARHGMAASAAAASGHAFE